MPLALAGSAVLITGASSGLGREFAVQLATQVRAMVLVARRSERLVGLAQELEVVNPRLRVSIQVCDLADADALERMVVAAEAAVGEIDILINNAGMGDLGLFDRAAWPKVERMLRVNVVALTTLTHRLLPAMVRRRRGGVLNVSSGFGLQFMPGVAAYVGTKHFVTGFTESLRCEVADCGVVVSQLCPGPVATEFEAHLGNFTGQKVPGFIEMDATRCVRTALRGFTRGRALIIPGVVIKLALLFGALTPRCVRRWVFGAVARRLRALQAAREAQSV